MTVPRLVAQAEALAAERGFDRGSIPEVGRLLAVLAAAVRPAGRLAESGTGTGIGAAWIASALPPDATLVTVELDPDLGDAARALLGGDPRVEVVTGEWREVLPPRAPFDLFFHDGGHWKRDADPLPIELLARGGVLVLDDMTPSRRFEPDPVRELVLGHPGLVATELLTTAETSAIVATRR